MSAWRDHGGLLAIRGLFDLSAADLLACSAIFGEVEETLDVSRLRFAHPESASILRLGNAPGCDYSNGRQLPPSGSCTYDPTSRTPIWHTDSLYREIPPIGSAFYCKQAPAEGSETCFADMRAAFESLSAAQQRELEGLEAVCSLAHHDTKLYRQSHDDELLRTPLLSQAEREANPPRRCPLVLTHPGGDQRGLLLQPAEQGERMREHARTATSVHEVLQG